MTHCFFLNYNISLDFGHLTKYQEINEGVLWISANILTLFGASDTKSSLGDLINIL